MKWYYYLHANGDVIGKNPELTHDSDLIGSDFVKRWWLIDLEERADLWRVLLEALAGGARLDRIKELAEKWKATKIDAFEMMVHMNPSEAQRRGLLLFIDKVLGMEADAFFDEFKAWGKAEQEKAAGSKATQ